MKSKLIGEVYETSQGLYCVRPEDQFVARQLIETGLYGQDQLTQLKQFCQANTRVLLLGAHLGSLAIPFSKFVEHMTIFEANPDTYKLLSINLTLNGCTNVDAFNFAASDKFEKLEFVLNTVNSGGSKRLPLHRDQMYFQDNPKVLTVPAVKLDDFLLGKKYDIIFMDIEGSEYFAMQGMPQLMSQAKVVVVEFIPHHLSRVGGITIESFHECFAGFQTLIVPSLNKVFYGDQIKEVMIGMFNNNVGDEGLIFVREKVGITF